jgi:hypothetical protein
VIGDRHRMMLIGGQRDPRRHDDDRRSRHVPVVHRADDDAGVQLASIGTQLSEAFAGLDRIREIRRMATEDQEDADQAPLPTCAARSRSTM